MKKVLLLTLICISISTKAQKSTEDNNIYTTVEKNPAYKNGIEALYSFFCENIKVPTSISSDLKAPHRIYIKFVVEKDGSVTNPEIIRGIDTACDKEAVRMINLLPKWEPGGITKYGNWIPLRVYFTVPIAFYSDKATCEKSYNKSFNNK